MKRRIRQWLSMILATSLMLCIVSPIAVFADSNIPQEESPFLEISSLPDNIRFLLNDTLSEMSSSGEAEPAQSVNNKARTADVSTQADFKQLQVLNTEHLTNIQVEDGNGNGRALVFGVPIRYTDEDGNIQFIDTSMEEINFLNSLFTDYDYQNAANNTQFQFSKKPDKGIRVDKAFTYAVYNPDKRKLPKGYTDKTAEGNGRMVYPEAFGEDTYVEYINTNTGLKENIVLQKNIGQNRFEFIFESKNYIPVLSEDKTVIRVVHRDDPDKIQYHFSDLYVYDSFQPQEYDTIEDQPSQVPIYTMPTTGASQSDNVEENDSTSPRHYTTDNYYEITQISNKKYKITAVVSDAFLNSPTTVYPVVVDPGISSVGQNSNAQDTFVWENDPNYAGNGSLNYLSFGKKSGGALYAYYRFSQLPQLGSSPYYVNITDASLKFTYRTGQTTGANGVCYIVYDHQWNESTLTWNNQPYGAWGYGSSHNNYQYYNFYVQPFVEMWYYGGYSNYGVMFTYDTMIADYNSVVSSEGDAARAPQLSITYKTVTSMSYDTDVSGTLSLGDYQWYKITPSYSGVHVFYSQGSLDMYGELFQGTTRLATNDDGGDDFNFRISYNLTAGNTYYLKVRGYDYEVTGYYQTKCLPDYTIPLNTLLANAVEQCKNNRCMNEAQYIAWCQSQGVDAELFPYLLHMANSFAWFFLQVKDGAVWDIKLPEKWTAALPNTPFLDEIHFSFRGYEITAEDMGNIMYGYTGRATGFGKTTLFWGGGVANQNSMNNTEVTTPPYYGDMPNDHENIDLGYDLFVTDYPNYPDVGINEIPVEPGVLAAIADALLSEHL